MPEMGDVPTARFEDDLAFIGALALREPASAEELVRNLAEVYQAVFSVNFSRYDPLEVRKSAPSLVWEIFDLRIKLRDRVAGWHQKGFMTRPAQKALRDVFRIARYGTDMLGELAQGFPVLEAETHTYRAFSGAHHNTLVNARHYTGKDLGFRSGDVLLMRGMAHNSAAIARIGDIDSQFSHLGIVYVDESNQGWVVESLIEDGAIINTLEHTLAHELGRCVLFRHRDAELAARAAKLIHDHVKRSVDDEIPHIYYDFSMRLDDYDQLYCSKLVRQAFDMASEGKVMIPTFTTLLDAHNRDFFRRIGVRTRETFSPGDMELEPDFDLVAEWQDYRVTSSLRLQDMIMTKLFEWMETRGYRFRETALVRLFSLFGRAASHLYEPLKMLISGVIPRVPDNMGRKAIGAVIMLHKTAEPLLDELKHLERRTIVASGRPLHSREVLAHLEGVRERSLGEIGYLHAPRRLFKRKV